MGDVRETCREWITASQARRASIPVVEDPIVPAGAHGPLPDQIMAGYTPEQIKALRGTTSKALVDTRPSKLRRPLLENDPQELLRHRFLFRGGVGVLVGPTGAGKSSATIQMAICWVLGCEAFGIKPAKPLRITIVQAENDEGDMAEMIDGVARGMQLSPEHLAWIDENLSVITEVASNGDEFVAKLDAYLAGHANKPDLIVIDPAFHYIGADANSSNDVGHFMRELLLNLVVAHNIGAFVVHHTNKPARAEDKGFANAGDSAYLGAGSAEWVNTARSLLALQSTPVPGLFKLTAAKRGGRLRWKDINGLPTTSRYIAHAREEGIIHWRPADAEDMEALEDATPVKKTAKDKEGGPGSGRVSGYEAYLDAIKDALRDGHPRRQSLVADKVAAKLKTSPRTIREAIQRAADEGRLHKQPDGPCNFIIQWVLRIPGVPEDPIGARKEGMSWNGVQVSRV